MTEFTFQRPMNISYRTVVTEIVTGHALEVGAGKTERVQWNSQLTIAIQGYALVSHKWSSLIQLVRGNIRLTDVPLPLEHFRETMCAVCMKNLGQPIYWGIKYQPLSDTPVLAAGMPAEFTVRNDWHASQTIGVLIKGLTPIER